MSEYWNIANALANAFLAGALETEQLVDRGGVLLGKRWRWLRPLARRIVNEFTGKPRPRKVVLAKFLLADRGFARVTLIHDLETVHFVGAPPTMAPITAANSWRVPALCTHRELADWLNVSTTELEWFADLKSFEFKRSHQKLRHYRYRLLTKRFGSARLIEAPKPRLKAIQRRILSGILDTIPPHDAAHGFRRDRSIKTFAAPHTGKAAVLKIDLQDFFPSITAARTQAIFRSLGYPERVADSLAGLCSNATPFDVWTDGIAPPAAAQMRGARWLYAKPHLPQGSPTSPALANLCAYRLDCRLTALAKKVGAVYTRYADDLAFSGGAEFARAAKRFQLSACAIVLEEGFRVHHRKTRIMRKSVVQQLAGVVVNEHLSVRRSDLDRLKATLNNCLRDGAESQNRDNHVDFRAHLQGRISFVNMINPNQGRRLRTLFDRIDW